MNRRAWTTPALILIAVFSLVFGGSAVAAPSPGGAQSTNDGTSKKGAMQELLDALESGGRVLLDMIKPEEEASPQSPQWNSLASPRHSIQTFLESMRYVERGHPDVWPRVYATMGLVGTDEPGQAQAYAHAIHESLIRTGSLDALSLPGGPDVEREYMNRYAVFPRSSEHAWVWDAVDSPPEGSIVLERNGDDAWVFTRATLDGAADLRDSLASLPPRFRDDKQSAFMSAFVPTATETAWWGWLMLAGCILVGGVLAWLTRRYGKKLATVLHERGYARTGRIARGLSVPLAMLLFAVALGAGTAFVELTGVLDQLRWGLLELLVFGSLGWLTLEVLDFVFVRYKAKAADDSEMLNSMAAEIAHRLLKVVVALVVAALLLQNVFGLDIAPVLAGIGVIGLAMSLAAKDSIKNLFGALTIFLYRPFVLGDLIKFSGEVGEVMELGTQSTQVRLLTGERLTIPNMKFITNEIENLSQRPYVRGEVNVALSYHSSAQQVDRAIEVLDEVMKSEEIVSEGLFRLEERPAQIHFTGFEDAVLEVKVWYWYFMSELKEDKEQDLVQRDVERDWWSYLQHRNLVHRRIHARFDEEGLDFAFPTQTIEVRKADDDLRAAAQ